MSVIALCLLRWCFLLLLHASLTFYFWLLRCHVNVLGEIQQLFIAPLSKRRKKQKAKISDATTIDDDGGIWMTTYTTLLNSYKSSTRNNEAFLIDNMLVPSIGAVSIVWGVPRFSVVVGGRRWQQHPKYSCRDCLLESVLVQLSSCYERPWNIPYAQNQRCSRFADYSNDCRRVQH